MTTSAPVRRRAGVPAVRLAPPPGGWLVVAAGVAAVAVGLATVVRPAAAALGVVVVAAVAVVWRHPAVAGYVLIGGTPLVAGIDRGRVLPVLRPNEALLLLVGGTLVARAAVTRRRGEPLVRTVDGVAVAIAAMAGCNSVLVLLWMALRGDPISHDDLLYAVVLWKYLALYLVVRASVRTDAQVRTALWLALGAGALVGVVAVLQSLQLFGVPHLLATYYAPFGDTSALEIKRGSSLLSLPAATADLMILDLAVVAGMWSRRIGRRPVLVGLAAVYVLATVASGQFSAAIGLVVAFVALAAVFRRKDILVGGMVASLVSGALLWPVISRRLAGFGTAAGMPESWVGRLHNLRTYFWPDLFSHAHFLLGVRPAARVPGPRNLGIEWVWIESGYTWLLWGGGLPLLFAFLVLVWVAVRRGWRLARTHVGARGVVGTAVVVGVVATTVLMLFDPHLTYRGSGDQLFALLGLLVVPAAQRGEQP